MNKQRVFITGIGPVSAVGIGREDFSQGLVDGRDGCITADFCQRKQVALCQDFALEDFTVSEKTYIDRCSALVLAACALALEDCGIDLEQQNMARCGLSLGTTWGCLESMVMVTERIQNKGVRLTPPLVFMHSFINSPVSLTAIEFGIKGPASTFSSGDNSSTNALQFAFDVLRDDRCDFMFAGGVEALGEVLLQEYGAEMFANETRIPGEGACLLALETESSMAARGAEPLAELMAVTLAGSSEDALIQAIKESALSEMPEKISSHEKFGHTFGASGALDIAIAIHKIQLQTARIIAVKSMASDSTGVMLVKAI